MEGEKKEVAPATYPDVYELAFSEEVVKLRNAQGIIVEYVLRELSGEARDRYLTNTIGRSRQDAEGKLTGMKDLNGFQAELLALCLTEKATGKSLDPEVIQAWPARVSTDLFKRAQAKSGIGAGAEAAAKNA